MPVVPTVRRHDLPTQQAAPLERRQPFVVALPDRHALFGNALGFLELRPQEGSGDLVREKRRADLLPGIFVDLAPEKPAAIRSLLAHDFGTQDKILIAQQQAAGLAGLDVL